MTMHHVPVAIAVPITPTSDYIDLPQAELRSSDATNAAVAMAIHVSDASAPPTRVPPAPQPGLEARLDFRKAVIFQLLYFTVSFVLFLPPWFPSALACAFGLLGMFASDLHVDVRRQRASLFVAILNGVLAMCFLSDLVFSSMKASIDAIDLDYAHAMLWVLDIPVLLYTASKAMGYYKELVAELACGVTVVAFASPQVTQR
ncbi:hypothetical protein H310_01983 [Aphanomyces invadans]|uniref:Uncharacterized protein n=1 Tax=Aphanomyces invadans TaxID=157072 RepID=A0A024UPE0_9STRA|nr:hypothetical protein H310_01983 [Aphanomyces invadans]ETW07473.1 hypothetical protein H310_01983 [Aphanomyces invadans]|eukprot:XP_008863566.1 hypothetical protein H310_01983 [Aphanomyces invadans]